MADIELVIKIPKNTYHRIQALVRDDYFEHDMCGASMRRIANGTPLEDIVEGIKSHKWGNNEGSKEIYNNAIDDVLTYIEEKLGE